MLIIRWIGADLFPINEYSNVVNMVNQRCGGGLVAGAPPQPIEFYQGWNLTLICKDEDTLQKLLEGLSKNFHQQLRVYRVNIHAIQEIRL
jgi:hypothetical protein